MKYSFQLCSLFLLIACTEPAQQVPLSSSDDLIPVDTSSSSEIQFVYEGEFGEIYRSGFPPAPIRGSGPKYAVDRNKSVYLADPYENHIKVISAEGELIKEIGRNGSGPGEFRGISGIFTQGDELVVFDGSLQRVQYFDINDFRLNRSFLFDPLQWAFEEIPRVANPVKLLPYSGNLLAALSLEPINNRDRYGYLELNDEGEQLARNYLAEERAPLQQSGSLANGMATSLTDPTSDKDLIQTSDSLILKLNTGNMIVELYDTKGEHLRSYSVPFDRLPVKKAQVLDEYDPYLHSIFNDADFPEYWPAAENFIVDDTQRIWVAGIVADRTINTWYVFDLSGELTGTFRWPRDEPILFVMDGKMYTSYEDADEGYKSVKRYSILFTEQ